jgi:hypothetical protein
VVSYRATGIVGRLETQLNLAMPSCDGYGGRYILTDGEIPCGFGQPLALERLDSVILDDGELGGSLIVATSRPASFSARPHHTVSQSEAGFEKIMQAAELSFAWSLAGPAGDISVVLEFTSKA